MGGPLSGSPSIRLTRVLAWTVSVETPSRLHRGPAKIATRLKKSTIARHIIAIGSRPIRPNAIWVGERPATRFSPPGSCGSALMPWSAMRSGLIDVVMLTPAGLLRDPDVGTTGELSASARICAVGDSM